MQFHPLGENKGSFDSFTWERNEFLGLVLHGKNLHGKQKLKGVGFWIPYVKRKN